MLFASLPQPEAVERKESSPLSEVRDNERVEEFVRAYFTDAPVMAEIAWCETKFKHFNRAGEVLRGEVTRSDTGVMQINEYFHGKTAKTLDIDIFSLEGNLHYARYLYEKEGTRPWNSSRHCWSARTGHIALEK